MAILLEGKISVKAALLSPYREVDSILIDEQKKDRDVRFIIREATKRNIEIAYASRTAIDEITSGHTHGGIVAYVQERSFQKIENYVSDHAFIAIVEGVEDPFNFGFICRSLYAAGVDVMILPPRNWTSAASTLAKASAGASEYLAMVVCEDYEAMLTQMKSKGIRIVCAQRDEQAKVMYEYDYTQSICICIGGEKRGLSKAILNQSDQNVYIPYQNDFRNALSAASASTILAYEVLRQRKATK